MAEQPEEARKRCPGGPTPDRRPRRSCRDHGSFSTPRKARQPKRSSIASFRPIPTRPAAKDAGSAVYIDRQLAGPYGRRAGLYVIPPFIKGTKQQGPQDADGPAMQFRKGLAALDQYCKKQKGGAFASLSDPDKDAIIGEVETGAAKLDGVDGQAFFELLLKNTQEGFFADPIYGGNRDMCAWRMIGYPGARYDYRDWVHRHNERYPLPPVSIMGRADWNARKT